MRVLNRDQRMTVEKTNELTEVSRLEAVAQEEVGIADQPPKTRNFAQ